MVSQRTSNDIAASDSARRKLANAELNAGHLLGRTARQTREEPQLAFDATWFEIVEHLRELAHR